MTFGTRPRPAHPAPSALPTAAGERLLIADGYLGAGVDCITTSTFGAKPGNFGEYGIADRIGELSEAGPRIARKVRYRGCRYAFGYPASHFST